MIARSLNKYTIFVCSVWLFVAVYIFSLSGLQEQIENLDQAMSAVENRPLSPYAWLALSKQLRNQEDLESQQKALPNLSHIALDVAASLSERRKFYLGRVFAEHVNSGRLSELAPVARRLSAINPEKLYQIFLYTKQIYGISGYLEKVLPGAQPDSLRTREFYFKLLFEGALRDDDAIMVGKIWSAASIKDKNMLVMGDVMDGVAQRLRTSEVGYEVIDRIARTFSNHKRFLGLDFPISFVSGEQSAPLCWFLSLHPASQFEIVPEQIKIKLPAVNDTKPHIARCYIPVNLSKPITAGLSGVWESNILDAGVVATLAVRVLGVDEFRKQTYLSKSAIKRGNWKQQIFDLEFSLDQDTTGIYIDISFPRPKRGITTNSFSIKDLNITCRSGCKLKSQ